MSTTLLYDRGMETMAKPGLNGLDETTRTRMNAPDEATQTGPSAADETSVRAWRALLSVHAHVLDGIGRDLAAQGLVPLTWVDVLVALWEAPDHRMRLSDLARRIVHSRSGLTRLVDRMEAEGLLRREACPHDRRGAFAVLTREGRAAQLAAWPVCAHGIAENFARHLSGGELLVLADALGRVAAAATAGCDAAVAKGDEECVSAGGTD